MTDPRPLPPLPPPLPFVLAERARELGERPLAVFDGETLTFAGLRDASRRLATGLARAGLRQGDTLLVMIGNRPEILACLFAAAELGVLAVPANVALKGESLGHVLRTVRPQLAIVEACWLERLREAIGPAQAGMPIYVLDGAAGQRDYAELLTAGNDVPAVPIGPGDPWLVLFTSGTTGVAKGVILPHQQLASAAWDAAQDFGMHADSVFYTFNPLFHLNGLVFGPLAALVAGARTVVRREFPRERTLADVRASGATHWAPVPFVTRGLLAAPPRPDDADNALQVVLTFGFTAAEAEIFQRRFGCRLGTGYGTTEMGMICRTQTERPTTSGRLSDRREMRIVDEEGLDVEPGEVGEILVRSRQPFESMLGYFAMPEATAAAFTDGWYRTGDLGRLDEDGYLHFADRAKDSLKRRGENISTFQVEQVLQLYPGVTAAAVVGYRPAAGAEEEVRAFLELEQPIAPEQFDFAAVIAHCGRHLAYFMVPRFIELVPALPRTALGKIEKHPLKKLPLGAGAFDARAAGVAVPR
jgi:crotonobetaine/carnitine-CoA ligase